MTEMESQETESTSVKSNRPASWYYWSDCGQVNFVNGWGWGLTSSLQSICLGKEADVLKALKEGKPPPDASKTQLDAWKWIFEYRGTLKNGESDFKAERSGSVRSRSAKDFEHRTADTKRPPPGKKLPGGKTKPKK